MAGLAWEWRRLFNEATSNLSAVGLSWYDRTGGDTLRRPGAPAHPSGPLAKALVETGPWMLDGGSAGRKWRPPSRTTARDSPPWRLWWLST